MSMPTTDVTANEQDVVASCLAFVFVLVAAALIVVVATQRN